MSIEEINNNIPELSPEQIEHQRKKDKALKCKMIVLNDMNMHPILTNVSRLKQDVKDKILEKVKILFDDENNDEDIKKKVYDLRSVIFDELDPKKDYTNYPIYDNKLITNNSINV
jgi:hypothetical protein